MQNLQELPRFADKLSYLYVEHAVVDRHEKAIAVHRADGTTAVPAAALGVLLLGPGTTITHAAVHTLADNNCQVLWCGEHGVRFYAQGLGGARHSRNLLRQAALGQQRVDALAGRDPHVLHALRGRHRRRHHLAAAARQGRRPRAAGLRRSVAAVQRSLGRPFLRAGGVELGQSRQSRPLRRQCLPVRRGPRGDSVRRLLAGPGIRPLRQAALVRLRRGRPVQSRSIRSPRRLPSRRRIPPTWSTGSAFPAGTAFARCG